MTRERAAVVSRILLAGLAALLVGTAPAAQRPQGLKFVDLTDDFDRVWTATKDVPDDQRAAAFEAAFAKILPGFYDPKRVADYVPADKYEARLLQALKDYPDHRAGVQRVSREFAGLIGPAQRSFEKAFGPMRGYPPIYLVVSFGEFDGGTRDLPEGNRLMFGADVIDKLYKGKPIQPFFHHELFHLLQGRTFDECDEAWCNLWSEGLAVYVAATLNPKADDTALLLTMPRPLRPAVEEHKEEAVCAVRARLHSTKRADYAPLFMGGGEGLSPNLPPRFGYYVGYLVARDLGRTHSLKRLAAMKNSDVQPLIEESLARMADCPPTSA